MSCLCVHLLPVLVSTNYIQLVRTAEHLSGFSACLECLLLLVIFLMYMYVFILLQVNEDKTKIRRIKPLTEPVNVDERTVYVVREVLVCTVCNYKIV